MLEMLVAGELDAAFVQLPDGGAPPGVLTRVLHAEDFVLVVGADHPLAGQPEVDVAALKDEDFITFTRGVGHRSALRAACRAAGFEPHAKFESSVLQTVRSLAASGLGVTMLPRSFAEDDEAAVIVPLAPPTPMLPSPSPGATGRCPRRRHSSSSWPRDGPERASRQPAR